MGVGAGARYPGIGGKSKGNKTTIIEVKMGFETAAKPVGLAFCSGIFLNKQRLGGRGAAAHGIDPHRMVHHYRGLRVEIAVC